MYFSLKLIDINISTKKRTMKLKYLSVLFVVYSCSDGLNDNKSDRTSNEELYLSKTYDKTRHELIEEICHSLDSMECAELKLSIDEIITISYSENGRAKIDRVYGKPFDKLSYRDVLVTIKKRAKDKSQKINLYNKELASYRYLSSSIKELKTFYKRANQTYDIGSFNEFVWKVQDSSRRRVLYNVLLKDNFNLQAYETYSKALTLPKDVLYDVNGDSVYFYFNIKEPVLNLEE